MLVLANNFVLSIQRVVNKTWASMNKIVSKKILLRNKDFKKADDITEVLWGRQGTPDFTESSFKRTCAGIFHDSLEFFLS